MYASLVGTDVFTSIAVLVVWALASWQLGKAVRRTEPKLIGRAVGWGVGWLLAGAIPVLAITVITVLFAVQDPQFAIGRTLLALPLIVVPAVFGYLWTLPVALRLRRGGAEPVDLAALRPALPPRLTALGGAFGLWMSFFLQPVTPLWDEILGYLAAYLVLGLLQVLKLRGVPAKVRSGARFPSRLRRTGRTAIRVIAFVAVVVAVMIWAAQTSHLPDRYNMVDHAGGHTGGAPGRPVTELTGDISGSPEQRFTLTAQATELTLPSGAKVQAWTFNGTVPGPPLEVRQGALIDVELINKDVPGGVSIHWHGVDVANASDGVPGLTQDAVPVGGRYTYRFRAPAAGSYWYHSHQVSSEQVRRGLYGAFIVDPAGPASSPSTAPAGTTTDLPVLVHTFVNQKQVLSASDQLTRQAVPAGRTVQLRLINTDFLTRRFTLAGVRFRVVAIDGSDLNAPAETGGVRLAVGGGGRYDIRFTMPNEPVRLVVLDHPDAGLLLSQDGGGNRDAQTGGDEFDPTGYGQPAAAPFDGRGPYAHDDTYYIDNHFGFYNGEFAMLFTLNGNVYPDIPATVVRDGDLIRIKFVNRSYLDHPMHIHGHHVLVLSRNGKPVTGSPLLLDTVLVQVGEIWEVALRADNPGLWMDHCHNLEHSAIGMAMHLTYAGYTTPFQAGSAAGNDPE
jgi:FtsP/CotA-like multicopper oxidase with cupredoxin domain